jgi:hypothetical protein
VTVAVAPGAGPAWLGELQARFGAALRAPLVRRSGGPSAAVRFDAALVAEIADLPILGPREQLGVYNRQYWFRLFGTLQTEYELTARLMGFAEFNGYAQEFLLASPPSGFDLHEVGDGFVGFLQRASAGPADTLSGVPRQAVLEAAAIDHAFRRMLYAPHEEVYRPSAAEADGLPAVRLLPSRHWALVEEHWPLVDLRRDLADAKDERRAVLPARLPAARWWLFCNDAAGAMKVAVVPALAARLFGLLTQHAVGDALGLLERECPAEQRARLPGDVQRWLAQSVELGFWMGREAPGST